MWFIYIYPTPHQVIPAIIIDMSSDTIQQLQDRYDRFRAFIFRAAENNQSEYLATLKDMPLTEFLAQGQLLITTMHITCAEQFAESVLAQTDLSEALDAAGPEVKKTLSEYVHYFWDVIKAIS